MCELLVMAQSRTSENVYQDVRLFKTGDVVIAEEAGWKWTREELNSALFVLFRVPDLPLIQGEAICVEEPGDPLSQPTLQVRLFKIDFTLLPTGVADQIDGVTRQQTFIDLTAADVNAAKVQKPPVQDPGVPS